MTSKISPIYSAKEEKLNVLTHGFGLLLAIIAFPFLILKSVVYQDFWQVVSFGIYGFSLLILYTASTFYHASKNATIRRRLNIFDHASIYVLIAGSYTPFCLVILPEKTGWYLFIFVWLFALLGVVLKLFFTGKYDKLSTILYLIMGWQVLFLIKPLMDNLASEGLFFLIAGGVFYTIGAVLYSIKKVPYNHAIFHVFVLLGSFSHFWAIFKYV
ncbi:PAQR family membrane homeostasis protein TrhA [Tenacibaculum piscium]|uniref:PAQR family membrane homeostasis protein TrhA n=1 Tax=Tenacibaculum piscium TaxID=1458515 RepID=UPI001F42D7FB|nr:hemolysin III family protein [Tenacibaculum piscium]MCG8183331.1 hemolysin III family protein [Tenacibaculum piscium]MCG8204485.1 hemolysin III family protein [Tenacibaculum piscium]